MNIDKLRIAVSVTFGLLTAMVSAPIAMQAQTDHSRVNNIVLVHGTWADGSSWSKIIPLLTAKGFQVVAVQNPLTSLEDDVTATKQAIARLQTSHPGPVLLVGHSYGGVVITEAGTGPEVAGLVYVAAFAPDETESALSLSSEYPTPVSEQLVFDSFGFVTLTREGIFDDFAQDLSPREREVLFVTQGPAAGAALQAAPTAVAWKVRPSWFVVASNDRTVSPVLEQFEANRMKATTITVPTCHVAMLSDPGVVAEFIATAAKSASH